MNVLSSLLVRRAKALAHDARGNVAVMFAIMVPVLLLGTGAAIDYSRAANARSKLQSAVDATALMISKEASSIADQGALKDKAYQYFNAIYSNVEAPIPSGSFDVVYTPNAGSGASVLITASGAMQTDFMKIAGPSYNAVPINVSATTKWGNLRYRVALALDNTGSMASASKMAELKTAATGLINDFYNMAGSDADVYISIVPFSRDVNVGTDMKNENWVRWTEWEETNGHCTPANSPRPTTKSACAAAGRTWHADNHNQWNGCVMDRDKNYDTTSHALTNTDPALMAPAQQYADCPVSVLGMTPVKSAKQTLLDKITAMTPVGTTNQSIGVFWAWQTLKTAGPFIGPAKSSAHTYMDVVILLTDGLNTENRWDSACTYWGSFLLGCGHETAVDDRQALLCGNLKTTGVKVFAIQVATDNDAVSTVTKNCTSEPNNPNYFSYITQASQMTVKFQNIFKELARLRVAA